MITEKEGQGAALDPQRGRRPFDPDLLRVRNLTVRYSGGVTAVGGVDFAVKPGEALGIVGESGSGKSSIAGAILDLLGPGSHAEGDIVFDGDNLATLAPKARRAILGAGIGSVFQDPFTALNPALRIGAQIAEPMTTHLRIRPAEAQARAIALLADMGIARPEAVAAAYPHQLSGGMKQRALIAAALACEPRLLILDEPTTALDVTVEAQILELLANLRRRKSIAMLFISHNLGVVRRVCDQVAVMYAGQIVERGDADRVLARPAHPYTRGLLASLPPLRPSPRGARLPSIAGHMPPGAMQPTTCLFAPRCAFAEPRCDTPQSLAPDAGGHLARCWKADATPAWPVPPAMPSAAPVFRRGDALLNATDLAKHFHTRRGLSAWRISRTGLRRDTGAVAAVDGVSLAISEGEVLGLVGESGCGKSTLGRLVLRLLRASAGSVEFDGEDIALASTARTRAFRRAAQLVFQNVGSSLNPRLSIGDALARPLALFDVVPRAQRAGRVAELLDMVRLPASYAARFPHQLSGGERQRVAIARALATGPRFLVCDEPVSALDMSVQAAIVNLLADLRDRLGLSYLFISHDLAVVAQLSDRIAVMYQGRICETGSAAEVLSPPYHPYTRALLASAAHEPPAEAASPRGAPGGCEFRNRCPDRMPVCDHIVPSLQLRSGTLSIACHRQDPVGPQV